MWSFLRRKERERINSLNNEQDEDFDFELDLDESEATSEMTFAELISTMGDVSDLQNNDAPLKFWVSEPVEEALTEVAKRAKLSLSEHLRIFFFLHCYGLYAYNVLQDLMPNFWREPDVRFSIGRTLYQSEEIRKRTPTYWVVELGKNVAPIKVWVPNRIKNDLTTLAEHVGLTRSNYCREIVISRLFGHGMLPKRPEMMDTDPLPDADNWAEDKEVTWMQVSEKEFSDYKIREARFDE